MNLGGDGPFQEWNAPDRWDWLFIIIFVIFVMGFCSFVSWLFGS